MRIIAKKKLRDYWRNHAQAELPLIEWYFKMKNYKASNIDQLRGRFNSVDPVHGYTIFNIAGNHYRLITVIHYNTQHCYIRAIWTHAENDKASNQEKLRRGEL